MGGEIAVKEIPTSHFPDPTHYFIEAQAMRRAHCPNVVGIKAASTAGDRICLVMEYLRNGSLQTRIQNGPLSLTEVIRVGQGMLKGLSQIHVGGIIHFDIKPSNVLFSPTNEAMLADFGQSRPAHTSGATPIPSLYIPAMPPETILTRHGDRLSDIFQAGLTLYRAVNGDPFYDAQIHSIADVKGAICRGKFPNRDSYLPHVPRWVRLVINRAMKVDPAKRYASASDFANALGRHPIKMNWTATPNGLGGMDWVAPRKGQSDLLVRSISTSGGYSVEVYTRTGGGILRAKEKQVSWRPLGTDPLLTESEATSYLRDLFQSKEQA